LQVQHIEPRSDAGQKLLPQISIHEGTPLGDQQVKGKLDGTVIRKVSIQERGVSVGQFYQYYIGILNFKIGSTATREGSARKKAKKPPKVPKYYAGALLKYSASTMQAIQAIEYAKLRTGRNNDFKCVGTTFNNEFV